MGLTYKKIVNYHKLHLLFKIQFAMSIYYSSKIIILDSVRAEIVKKLEGMDQEAKKIRKRLIEYCWYMRGGMTLDEGFATCHDDRSLMSDIVKENLETTKTSGLPFF